MSTLTRKQREIQEREQRVLDLAREMLAAGGYLGLNMDAIAVQLEYSKGTIYNHFPCKEEIIIALAIETMEKRTQMFLPGRRVAGPNQTANDGNWRSGRIVCQALSESFQC